MRRDICYYFEADVRSVYNAFYAAATNPVFRRECKSEPYHSLSFGLGASFKFNMNGGACIIHFIPCNTGTAVDLRFTLAQVLGARYGAYAKQLSAEVSRLLGNIPAAPCNIPIEEFLKEEYKIKENNVPPAPQPAPQPVPQPAPRPQPMPQPVNEPLQPPVQSLEKPAPVKPQGKTCTNCGANIAESDVFCRNCGTKADTLTACPQCGNKDIANSKFCCKCGNKLN
ncbi:MAG: zinc ribbon domain-containing protein [Clostridia bacterium]|nr:zinc ribbon domain-containing protein [Clostridia bacterium]